MKLIVQIPCFNEEKTLPATVADIPRQIDGVDEIEILIVDDGSQDRTSAVAREIGVDHIIANKRNLGLAGAFRIGLDECLKRGADIIVNTDGDNQYAGRDIAKLIRPIIEHRVDLVVGSRNTASIGHFSRFKRLLERIGSHVVRSVAGVDVPDAVSGFRAISREAALKINIISPFSYTIEMLIQAGKKSIPVLSVPVETNAQTRKSRLFSSTFGFIERQLTTIVRMYAMYQPLRAFFFIGAVLIVVGIVPIVRFLYFYFLLENGTGHIQSLVLGGVFLILGSISWLIALVADLINFNRQLVEITLEKVRRIELERLGRRTGRVGQSGFGVAGSPTPDRDESRSSDY